MIARRHRGFHRTQERWNARLIFCIAVISLVSASSSTGSRIRSAEPPGTAQHHADFLPTNFSNENFSTSSYGNASSWPAPALAPSVPLPPLRTQGNWPTYEHDQARTGDSGAELTLSTSNASQLAQIWTNNTTAGIFGSLAVVNGTVYVGDYSGNESAYAAVSGTRLWTTLMAGGYGNYSWTGCGYKSPINSSNAIRGITATAAFWNGTIFVPADNNNLYAINAVNGSIIHGWPVNMTNNSNDSWKSYYPWGSALVYHGEVYIGTASGCDSPLVQGRLLEVNVSRAAIAHQVSMAPGKGSGGGVWSTPALEASTNTVWITTGNCNNGIGDTYACNDSLSRWTQAIIGLNATNVCQPVGGVCTSRGYWHINGTGDIDFGAGASVIRLANGTTMVWTENKAGYAYGFYADTLSSNGASIPAWSIPLSVPHGDISPAAYDGSTLYLGGLGNGSCSNGTIRAVNPGTGKQIWGMCSEGEIQAGLTVADGLLIDGTEWKSEFGGTLEVRSAATGVVLKSWNYSQAITGEPVVWDGRIYVGTGNLSTLCGDNTKAVCPRGHLYAYGLPVGGSNSTAVPYVGPGPQLFVYAFGNATGGMPTYNYTWSWGDGQVSYGRNPVGHLYANGRFVLVLTVTDGAGSASQTAWEVYQNYYSCGGGTLKFCFTSGVIPCVTVGSCFLSIAHPQPLVLLAVVVNGIGGLAWNWNFGDGSAPSTAARPTHTYASHGTYLITVTVTDQAQHQSTQQFQVQV